MKIGSITSMSIQYIWKGTDRMNQTTRMMKHMHYNEIVVSKEELIYQLGDSNCWDNLLQLLIYGREHQSFEQLITLTALKCEFLGSLVYSDGSDTHRKPLIEIYPHELFEIGYADADELTEYVRDIKINSLSQPDISLDDAGLLYRKLLFVIYTCVPCIADETEVWWACTYRYFIEYAIENDSFNYPQTNGFKMYGIVDYNTPELSKRADKRNYVLEHIPDSLRSIIIYKDEISGFRN